MPFPHGLGYTTRTPVTGSCLPGCTFRTCLLLRLPAAVWITTLTFRLRWFAAVACVACGSRIAGCGSHTTFYTTVSYAAPPTAVLHLFTTFVADSAFAVRWLPRSALPFWLPTLPAPQFCSIHVLRITTCLRCTAVVFVTCCACVGSTRIHRIPFCVRLRTPRRLFYGFLHAVARLPTHTRLHVCAHVLRCAFLHTYARTWLPGCGSACGSRLLITCGYYRTHHCVLLVLRYHHRTGLPYRSAFVAHAFVPHAFVRFTLFYVRTFAVDLPCCGCYCTVLRGYTRTFTALVPVLPAAAIPRCALRLRYGLRSFTFYGLYAFYLWIMVRLRSHITCSAAPGYYRLHVYTHCYLLRFPVAYTAFYRWFCTTHTCRYGYHRLHGSHLVRILVACVCATVCYTLRLYLRLHWFTPGCGYVRVAGYWTRSTAHLLVYRLPFAHCRLPPLRLPYAVALHALRRTTHALLPRRYLILPTVILPVPRVYAHLPADDAAVTYAFARFAVCRAHAVYVLYHLLPRLRLNTRTHFRVHFPFGSGPLRLRAYCTRTRLVTTHCLDCTHFGLRCHLLAFCWVVQFVRGSVTPPYVRDTHTLTTWLPRGSFFAGSHGLRFAVRFPAHRLPCRFTFTHTYTLPVTILFTAVALLHTRFCGSATHCIRLRDGYARSPHAHAVCALLRTRLRFTAARNARWFARTVIRIRWFARFTATRVPTLRFILSRLWLFASLLPAVNRAPALRLPLRFAHALLPRFTVGSPVTRTVLRSGSSRTFAGCV